MRMAAFSEACVVPIATIKYYIREGQVPPGVRSVPNQADYGHEHVRRLRLIRTLVGVGDLPLATVRIVLSAIDDEAASTHEVLGVVHSALATKTSDTDAADDRNTIEETVGYLDRRVEREARRRCCPRARAESRHPPSHRLGRVHRGLRPIR